MMYIMYIVYTIKGCLSVSLSLSLSLCLSLCLSLSPSLSLFLSVIGCVEIPNRVPLGKVLLEREGKRETLSLCVSSLP